jgi:hypothetical protein
MRPAPASPEWGGFSPNHEKDGIATLYKKKKKKKKKKKEEDGMGMGMGFYIKPRQVWGSDRF